jgi:hypothetical protein
MSVSIVRYAPKAFSSLASVAESVNSYPQSNTDKIKFTHDITTTETNAPVTISWNKDPRAGTYAFSYACADGLSLDIVDTDGLRSTSCDTRYSIGDTDKLTFIASADKAESSLLSYAISFSTIADSDITRLGQGELTVRNTNYLAETPTKVTDFVPDTITPPIQPEAPIVNQDVAVKPTKITPVVNQRPAFTDLVVVYRGIGRISGSNFIAGSVNSNDTGAVQFSIINQGSASSDDWTYAVTMPDGDTYISPLQAPLRSGERSTIAINFDSNDKSSHEFQIVVAEETDIYLQNNIVSKTVRFGS